MNKVQFFLLQQFLVYIIADSDVAFVAILIKILVIIKEVFFIVFQGRRFQKD